MGEPDGGAGPATGVGVGGGATPIPAGRPLRFELTWEAGRGERPVDLDIGCFYWATDGSRGAVQSVGGRGPDPRSATTADGRELLTLSSDRTDGGSDGERLVLHRPGSISFLVVHTSIYDGAADFREVGARISVRSGRRTLAGITLTSPAPGLDWCAVVVLGPDGPRLHLAHEERYFRSAFHADRHYGLGLSWGVGHKPGPGPSADPALPPARRR
jgi:tellurite resistance protein TerA